MNGKKVNLKKEFEILDGTLLESGEEWIFKTESGDCFNINFDFDREAETVTVKLDKPIIEHFAYELAQKYMDKKQLLTAAEVDLETFTEPMDKKRWDFFVTPFKKF